MVELGLTMDGDFKVGGDDVVAVGVKLDVDVESKESCAHMPDVGSQRAPSYVLSFWDIKDRPLSNGWENKIKTKQNRQRSKQGQIRLLGVALRGQIKKKQYSST